MALTLAQPAPAPNAPVPERTKYLVLRDALRAEGDRNGVDIASAAFNGDADAIAACDAEIARRAGKA